MVKIEDETHAEWTKRVDAYKFDTSDWIQLPDIGGYMNKKNRIKYLEEKVSALTNALNDLDDRYMNNVKHTLDMRQGLLIRIEDNDKQIHKLLVRINSGS